MGNKKDKVGLPAPGVNSVPLPDIDATDGELNAPPLEMTIEDKAEIMDKEREKEEKKEVVSSGTKHYLNGENEWKLIAKTWNEYLGHEHVTQAMSVGGGCLVMVKEAIGQKMHSTMVYVPNIRIRESLINKEKHYILR